MRRLHQAFLNARQLFRAPAITPAGADIIALLDASAGLKLGTTTLTALLGLSPPPTVSLYQNQQSSGTTGPTFTAGAWRTFPLNTDILSTGDLSSNQITKAAATYEVFAIAQPGRSNAGQSNQRIRLYNATDAAAIVQGIQYEGLAAGAASPLQLHGYFTLAGTKALELQVYPKSFSPNFNPALTTGEAEIYGSVLIRKVA